LSFLYDFLFAALIADFLPSAPQLDAIFGIVNMHRQLSCSASHGDAIGILLCDKRSNKE
jgi:hypothetical protein